MKGAPLEIFLRREGADQFSSYGEVAAERQTDIIPQLAQPIDPDPQFEEILKQLVRAVNRTPA